jgi:hypothetical protein
MFGKKQRMINRLEREGVRAPATVVEIAKSGTETRSEGFNPIGEKLGLDSKTGYYATRKATLRVSPQGEPEFEAQDRFRFAEYGRTVPKAGDRIDVLYDPDDHAQVCVAPPTAEEEALRTAEALSKAKIGFTVGGQGAPPRPASAEDRDQAMEQNEQAMDQAQAMLEQAQQFMGDKEKREGKKE